MLMELISPDRESAIVTAKGEFFGDIPDEIRDMFAVRVSHREDSSTAVGISIVGEIFINPEYEYHPDVVQLKQYFVKCGLGETINNVTSAQIRELYDKSDKSSSSQSSIQREIKEYFNVAANQNASDVHITVRENGSYINIRRQGDLYRFKNLTSEQGNSNCRTIYTTMCDVADKSFQPTRYQGGRIAQLYLPDKLTGVRIQTTPTENGYKMICRLLYDAKDSATDLLSLGYEDFQQEIIEYFMSKKSGVVIISGPTGSGKSTTLQKVISNIITISNGTLHVVTVEDPPEYEIFGIEKTKKPSYDSVSGKLVGYTEETSYAYATQIPVTNAKTPELKNQKFGEAISAGMRLDPDVMMIGEIRDNASAGAALKASMTGHQVWTTVHANNCLVIFSRLFDIGVNKGLACDAEVINGLMSQRLVKKVCTSCGLPLKGNESILEPGITKRLHDVFSLLNISMDNIRLKNPKGCSACDNVGTVGRTVISEIIRCDDQFMELTLTGKKVDLKKYWLDDMGGVTMLMHGLIKIYNGICDPRDVEAQTEHLSFPAEANIEKFVKLITTPNKNKGKKA